MVNQILLFCSIYSTVCWAITSYTKPQMPDEMCKQDSVCFEAVRDFCTTVWSVPLVLKFVNFQLVRVIWFLKSANLIKYIPISTQITRSNTFNYKRFIPWTHLKMWWKLRVFSAYTHTYRQFWSLLQESASQHSRD